MAAYTPSAHQERTVKPFTLNSTVKRMRGVKVTDEEKNTNKRHLFFHEFNYIPVIPLHIPNYHSGYFQGHCTIFSQLHHNHSH